MKTVEMSVVLKRLNYYSFFFIQALWTIKLSVQAVKATELSVDV